MKVSRVFAGGHKSVGGLYVSADTVSDTIRSNNELTKKHAKYRGFSAPFVESRAARRPLWLIVKQEKGWTEVFTIHPGSGRETLPIFSHEEEAEMFLWLATPGGGWRARGTTAGELVSLLHGPCADAGRVALDPLPLCGGGALAGLVSLLREDFMRNLMEEREPRAPCQGSYEPETSGGSGISESFGRRRV